MNARRQPGRTRPRITDVAKAAGVSPGLVSRAMNGQTGVGEEARERIFAAAEQLGYRANPAARSLRTGRTGVAGMITRNLANPYFLDLIRGAQSHASGAEIRLAVLDSDYDAAAELDHIEYLIGQQADALAIAPVGDGASVRRWTSALPQSRTVIINAVAREVPGLLHVSPDNAAAVQLAINHLLDLDHKRIAFLTAPAPLMADHDRLETFHELTVPEPIVVETPLDLTSVKNEIQRLLDDPNPPTAIVTNSDHTAHAVYLACRHAGAKIGHDISVIGHDDLPTSELLDPPLTTLRLDRIAIGAAIAKRLHHQGPTSDHVQPVELIARPSTAPPQ